MENPVSKLCKELNALIVWAPRCTWFRAWKEIGFIRFAQKKNVLAVEFRSPQPLQKDSHYCHLGRVYDSSEDSFPHGVVVASDETSLVVVLAEDESIRFELYNKSVDYILKWLSDNNKKVISEEDFVYPYKRFAVKDMKFVARSYSR